MTRFRRDVLTSSSPRGVAPPVSDDCAPMTSTPVAAATPQTSATSASLGRGDKARGVAAGEMRRVLEIRREHVGIANDGWPAALRLWRVAAGVRGWTRPACYREEVAGMEA